MEAEELGAEGEEQPLFLPASSSWRPQKRVGCGGGCVFSFASSLPSFLCNFFGASHIVFGLAWAESKGELAACRFSGLRTGN